MEFLDTEPSDITVTALPSKESSEDLFGTLEKSAPAHQYSSAYSSDLFGDTFSSSASAADQCLATQHENDIFFSLDDTADGSSASVFGQQDWSTPAKEKAAKVEEVSASSSLFDDLLDFSSPLASETDHVVVVDNSDDAKPVPKVDLLFDVDDGLVSPTGSQPEVKAKAPDILDFVDVSCDLPEITSLDATDGTAYGSLTDGWDLLTDVTSSKMGSDRSPDIVVTSSGRDLVLDSTDDDDEVTLAEPKEDETDGAAGDKQSNNDNHTERADDAEQITDGDIKDKTADIHYSIIESDKMKDNFQDIDFSILELPGASNFNFDHFKHKRNISQKGSIANRKKPKRATIQPVGEDSIFLDSTEPKSQKPQNEDVPDSGLSLDHSKGDKAPETSGELSAETSPTRKLAGGIKIPGLLEGLSKSKVFARAEKTSPVAEPESKPEIVNPPPASDTETPSTTLSAVTSPPVTTSPPLIRPKPVVLPRVLPKPATKTLKEAQNQITASSIVTRASSFRNATSSSGTVDKPSLLAGPVALSRSASVKVAPVSAIKDVELSSVKEEKSSSVPLSKLIPPKPGLRKPLSPVAVRSVNKTPPPVPVKPSVAAKPGRASLGWSSSFSGGKSPLLPGVKSETKTGVPVNKEQSPDSDVIVKAEKKVDYMNNARTEKKYVSDNKPLSSGFSNDGKPPSVVQKKTEIPPAISSEKTDATDKIDPTNITRTEKKYVLDKKPLSSGFSKERKPPSFVQKKTEVPQELTASEKTDAAAKEIDSTNTGSTEKKYVLDKKPLSSGFSNERKPLSFVQKKTEVPQALTASEKTDAAEKEIASTNTGITEKKNVSDKTPLSSTLSSERKPPSFVQRKLNIPPAVTSLEKTDTNVEIVKSTSVVAEASKSTTVNRIPSVQATLPSGFVPRPAYRAGENYANVEAKKADTLDADDVFDTAADKTVSSVNTAESSTSADKYDSANDVDDILQRRKSSISGFTPVKSPLTGDKFPSGVPPRKGSITGSAYNPIGFRSTLGSSDSDQRSRTSSVSSSVEGAILAPEPAGLPSSMPSPSPQPRAGSDASCEDQMSRNGSLITAAVEKVRSSPDKFSEGGSEKAAKSNTKSDTKLISNLLPSKGDEKKTEFSETKSENQNPPKPLRESTSPAQLNGGPASAKSGQASEKSTSPWNVQLKKVDKKESPKPEPAVKTNDSQPANWRQQLSVRQKNSVPPKNTEKPKQDSTPDWAKASIKRRQRLIESGVIRGDS